MSTDYSNAKTSFHIEEQLPSFVRSGGQKFIDFIKTYYDWLERRYLMCYLKSEYDFSTEEILGEYLRLNEEHFLLTSEDDAYQLTPETYGDIYALTNIYSILFDGISNYGDVSTGIVDIANSWTISLWLKPNARPSYLLQDFDIITLSNTSYMSALKIRKEDDQFGFNFLNQEIDLKIDYRQDVWQYVTIRYDSVNKLIKYDIYNDLGYYTTSHSIDLSSSTSNRFVLGTDLYIPDRNFFSGNIDEIATWSVYLTDEDVLENYNSGNPIDLFAKYSPESFNSIVYQFDDASAIFNQSSSTAQILKNYFRFEDLDDYTVSNLAGTHDMDLYHSPVYSIDVPVNIEAIISENEIAQSLSLKVISAIKLENAVDGIMGNRVLAFCEHIKGVPVTDSIVFTTNQFVDIYLDSYTDIRNPLSAINNLEKYHEIDYAFTFDNFIYDQVFIAFWKEIMDGFPLYLNIEFDRSIKDIIAKNIKDFYSTKGTFESFKYLFKIMYGEDIEIGTDIYSDDTFSYVLNAHNAITPHVMDYIKTIVHPVGFNITLNVKI